MDKVFEITALGKDYKCRYDKMYGYYWVTSPTGYTFKVDKETFDSEYFNKESTKRATDE